jgi:hypothetical protein
MAFLRAVARQGAPFHLLQPTTFDCSCDAGEALPDEEVEDLRADYQSLGTISVQVWRKEHLGIRLAESHTCATKIGGTDPVPEKALKGRALSVAAR